MKALAQAHIEEVNEKLAELQAVKATLEHLVHCCHGDDRPDCPIIQTLESQRVRRRTRTPSLAFGLGAGASSPLDLATGTTSTMAKSPSIGIPKYDSASLFVVKLLRTWLLVLLAVLLPVRGAMAATMLCTPGGGGTVHAAMSAMGEAEEHRHDGHAIADAGQHHDHAKHDHDDSARDHASHDKCNVCSSSCSSPPLPSASVGVEEPQALNSVSFPDLSAPPPTFQSGGQERPPRTI